MSRRVAILALAGLGLAGAVPTAVASPAFRLLGGSGVISDGVRYAALRSSEGEPPLLIDTATQGAVRLPPPLAPSEARCELTGLGARQALWTCSRQQPGGYSSEAPVPILTDLTTRASRPVAGYERLFDCPQITCGPLFYRYDGVGRAWVRVNTGPSFIGVRYLSRTTGEVRPGIDAPRSQADLDRPGLARRLCPPARRPRAGPGVDGQGAYAEVGLQGRYVLIPSTTPSGGSGGPLRLFRCGTRHARRLSRCRPQPCRSANLSAGVATWAQGSRVWAYRLRTRRRVAIGSVPVGPVPSGASAIAVSHTRTRVFATALQQRGAVYVARLPRR